MRNGPRKITITVNEKPFDIEVYQLKTSEQLSFLMFMSKVIGGSAGKFIGAMDGKKVTEMASTSELNIDKIGDAVAGLFDRLDEKGFMEKLNLLLSSARHNGESLDVDHFAFEGNLPELFKVAKIAIEVNFKSFLPAISALVSRGKAMAEKAKNTPETLT